MPPPLQCETGWTRELMLLKFWHFDLFFWFSCLNFLKYFLGIFLDFGLFFCIFFFDIGGFFDLFNSGLWTTKQNKNCLKRPTIALLSFLPKGENKSPQSKNLLPSIMKYIWIYIITRLWLAVAAIKKGILQTRCSRCCSTNRFVALSRDIKLLGN